MERIRRVSCFRIIASIALLLGGLLPLSVYSEEPQVLTKERLPVPQTGLGHAIGEVVPIEKGLPVYLFPKERLGFAPREEHSDLKPVARTDENGKWVALNVKPGHYCVLHFDPNHMDTLLVFFEEDFKEIKAGAVTKFPTKTPPIKNR